jgi:hypothetical protein
MNRKVRYNVSSSLTRQPERKFLEKRPLDDVSPYDPYLTGGGGGGGGMGVHFW